MNKIIYTFYFLSEKDDKYYLWSISKIIFIFDNKI